MGCFVYTSVRSSWWIVIGAIGRRGVLSDDGDVVLVLDFAIKRSRCSHHARLAINTELAVVTADLLDTIRHLNQQQQLSPTYQCLYRAPIVQSYLPGGVTPYVGYLHQMVLRANASLPLKRHLDRFGVEPFFYRAHQCDRQTQTNNKQ